MATSNDQAFLDIPRKNATRQAVEERLRHYREIYKPRTAEELQQQASRCMDCGTPFCHGAGCPLGNLIPEFNDLVARGRWKEAADLLQLTNNFPEVTGRVCPALCEASCVNTLGGDAVTIREIELNIMEKAWQEGWIVPMPPVAETEKRVAVIGSGPAGMAAAQQLRRAGHTVVLFEKAPKPGGVLRLGIPDFKLEKHILDRRFDQMEKEGVQIRCNTEVNAEVLSEWKAFDAICLTGGAMQPRDLPIPGRELEGIHFAMDFLTQNNRRQAGMDLSGEREILATGKRVVIIGGGDTGSDCLGTSLRQGATEVVQLELLPAPPETRAADNPWPQWPLILRSSSSHEEGGSRDWCINTVRFQGADDHVTGLECVRVEWEKGADGRWNMTPCPGTEFTLETDLVLLAMGFTQPVHAGLLDDLGVAYDARGNVQADPDTMRTSVEGVFTAGDMNTGAWLVVGAIAAGRRMARRVDQFLMGSSDLPECELPPKL